MTGPEELGRRYYRLALGAAKLRDLSAALGYTAFARILNPGLGDAARLEEICRSELGEGAGGEQDQALEGIARLAGQKQWKKAANAARELPGQNTRLLNIQGCLWALAKRHARAMDCFAEALARDRGNRLAAEALAELGRRRPWFRRFF
jgi:tetratricopeptide (TPR) repeat protein